MVCRSCGLDLPAVAYRDAIDRWKDEVCERGEDGDETVAATDDADLFGEGA